MIILEMSQTTEGFWTWTGAFPTPPGTAEKPPTHGMDTFVIPASSYFASFSKAFCSFPSKSCFQSTSVISNVMPPFNQTYAFSQVSGFPTPNVTCLGQNTIHVSRKVSEPGGMTYEFLFRVRSPSGTISCQNAYPSAPDSRNASLQVVNVTFAWVTWAERMTT